MPASVSWQHDVVNAMVWLLRRSLQHMLPACLAHIGGVIRRGITSEFRVWVLARFLNHQLIIPVWLRNSGSGKPSGTKCIYAVHTLTLQVTRATENSQHRRPNPKLIISFILLHVLVVRESIICCWFSSLLMQLLPCDGCVGRVRG